MNDILSKVQVHMPFHLLSNYQETILERKLNPEIYFNHYALQNIDRALCAEAGKLLSGAGLRVTFHAPFMDLRPGALDDKIRQTSIDRIKEVFDLSPYFQPIRVVCHASFDDRYYVDCDDLWLEKSIESWTEMIVLANDAKTTIALENVYEKDPHILRRLFEALSSDRICFCFDTGHFNVFSRAPLNIWLQELGKYLGQLHLHDNFGQTDEHLPVGKGNFPFAELFASLKKNRIRPIATLEAHAQDDLWESLGNIKRMSLLDFI